MCLSRRVERMGKTAALVFMCGEVLHGHIERLILGPVVYSQMEHRYAW